MSGGSNPPSPANLWEGVSLLVRDFIGASADWHRKEAAEAFLREFVEAIDPSVEVGVSGEEFFQRDVWTLHLSKSGKRTAIEVSFEELVNCNSVNIESSAQPSQEKLEQKVRRALGEIDREHRKLGFI